MKKTERTEPPAAAPALPPHGGNWERLPDGSLRLIEQTLDAAAGDAGQPGAEEAAATKED